MNCLDISVYKLRVLHGCSYLGFLVLKKTLVVDAVIVEVCVEKMLLLICCGRILFGSCASIYDR